MAFQSAFGVVPWTAASTWSFTRFDVARHADRNDFHAVPFPVEDPRDLLARAALDGGGVGTISKREQASLLIDGIICAPQL